MPRLFTSSERNETLEQLIEFARSSDAIAGTLLVGSGSDGFSDEYSDIDVVFVADPGDHAEVLDATSTFLAQKMKAVFLTSYRHRHDVTVLCALPDNLLEMDIGVWSRSSLFASSPKWKGVQSRDSLAAESITRCMLENLPATRDSEPLITGDHSMWQTIHGQFIAEKRGDATVSERYRASLVSKLNGVPLNDFLLGAFSETQIHLINSLVARPGDPAPS